MQIVLMEMLFALLLGSVAPRVNGWMTFGRSRITRFNRLDDRLRRRIKAKSASLYEPAPVRACVYVIISLSVGRMANGQP